MILLDLFCGAGGASMGYWRAGYKRIIGIDIDHQPNYPFEFIQGDAFDLDIWPTTFDAIHASPPCTEFTTINRQRKGYTGWMLDDSNLLRRASTMLKAFDVPHIIENVEGAPMPFNTWHGQLCGSSFGLDLRRHRRFTCNRDLGKPPPCDHRWQTPRFRSLAHKRKELSTVVTVAGHCNYDGELELRRRAMEIDWMINAELVEAVPPAYTEWLGTRMLAA